MASKSLLRSLDYGVTIQTFKFIDTEPNPFKKRVLLWGEGGGGGGVCKVSDSFAQRKGTDTLLFTFCLHYSFSAAIL